MHHASSSVRLLVAVLGAGLLAGLGLDLLTFAVARYGPQGGDGAGWSFRCAPRSPRDAVVGLGQLGERDWCPDRAGQRG